MLEQRTTNTRPARIRRPFGHVEILVGANAENDCIHAALRAAGRAGRKPRRKPRLAPAQMVAIEAALRQGPRVHGFRTNLWTLPRVARLIKRLTGVQYHPGHVWRLLGALDWTLSAVIQ